MKQEQETNQIWTQEAGTDDTHNRTLTLIFPFLPYLNFICIQLHKSNNDILYHPRDLNRVDTEKSIKAGLFLELHKIFL